MRTKHEKEWGNDIPPARHDFPDRRKELLSTVAWSVAMATGFIAGYWMLYLAYTLAKGE